MADLEKIIKDLSSLSVVEAAELSKKLEEAWGVSAAAPAAVAVAPVEEKAEEQTEFEIVLQEVGSNKISVIKEVRTITLSYTFFVNENDNDKTSKIYIEERQENINN